MTKMVTIDEQIEILQKGIRDINDQCRKLWDDIFYLRKRKMHLKNEIQRLKEKKDGGHDNDQQHS